ncbi:uncharacterized protein L3040_002966 [Drepanopeziza brunnea f. sp. 'multigermtubi']|uniref:uncharacterized protein n=1 Tax=Drepanopeziza brunnea f. sp. 'multigermtubi' TaxID=698441 RepID=UPI0023941127|nr:hypothetical protein L3040_002966 [Drepanopeziza brunnea f. sp. 'multigermtubi']
MEYLKKMILDPVIAMAKEKAANWLTGQQPDCDLFANVVQPLPNSPVNIESQEKWADAMGGCVKGVRNDNNGFGIMFRYRELSTVTNRMASVLNCHTRSDSMYAEHSERCGIKAFHPRVTPKNITQLLSDVSSTAADDGEEDNTTLVDINITLNPPSYKTGDKIAGPVGKTVDPKESIDDHAVRPPVTKNSILERSSNPEPHNLPPCSSFKHHSGFPAGALPTPPKLTYLDLEATCQKAKESDLRLEAREKARTQEKDRQNGKGNFENVYEEGEESKPLWVRLQEQEPELPNHTNEYTYAYNMSSSKLPPPREPTIRRGEKFVDGYDCQAIARWYSWNGHRYPIGKNSAGFDARWSVNRNVPPRRGDLKQASWRRAPNSSGDNINDLSQFLEPDEIRVAYRERYIMRNGREPKGRDVLVGVTREAGTGFPIVYTQGDLDDFAKAADREVAAKVSAQFKQSHKYERRPVPPKDSSAPVKSLLSISFQKLKADPSFAYYQPRHAPRYRLQFNSDVDEVPCYPDRLARQKTAQEIPHDMNFRMRGVAPSGYEVKHSSGPANKSRKQEGNAATAAGDMDIPKLGRHNKTSPIDTLGKSYTHASNEWDDAVEPAKIFASSFKQQTAVPDQRSGAKAAPLYRKPSVSRSKTNSKRINSKGNNGSGSCGGGGSGNKHLQNRKVTDPHKMVHIPVTIVEMAEDAEDEEARNPKWMLELLGP